MVKIVTFSMTGMFNGSNGQFQHGWNVSILCHGQNRKFQHGWNVSESESFVSAWLEKVVEKTVKL
jgi:hypothetical protein